MKQPTSFVPSSRARLVLGLLLLTIVTACGNAGGGAGAGPATGAGATPAPSAADTAPSLAAVPSPVASAVPAGAPPTGTPRAVAPKLPATVSDKDGRPVTITDVSRIVPLTGTIAEIVWALGLGDNVVGAPTSASYPPEARERPKIGYQRQLAAEGILSLGPTVAIGDASAGPPPVLEQLRAAGLPVVIVADTPSLDAPAATIRAVAAALGVPEAGERLAARTQAEIDEARALAERATTRPTVMFLYVRGAGTQSIGGRGTTADALIAAAGGADAGTLAGISNYKPLTAEALVAAQPDVFLLLSAGLDSIGGVDGLLGLPGVAQTPAGQARRVLAYDDLYLLGLGPRTGQALRDLTLGLHPELR